MANRGNNSLFASMALDLRSYIILHTRQTTSFNDFSIEAGILLRDNLAYHALLLNGKSMCNSLHSKYIHQDSPMSIHLSVILRHWCNKHNLVSLCLGCLNQTGCTLLCYTDHCVIARHATCTVFRNARPTAIVPPLHRKNYIRTPPKLQL